MNIQSAGAGSAEVHILFPSIGRSLFRAAILDSTTGPLYVVTVVLVPMFNVVSDVCYFIARMRRPLVDTMIPVFRLHGCLKRRDAHPDRNQ